ncbi:MAG: hypothetical protein IH591_12935, partial [Bacteroidales bacterium]|nr:hypothetical protein [Bacteroidales bacterium]
MKSVMIYPALVVLTFFSNPVSGRDNDFYDGNDVIIIQDTTRAVNHNSTRSNRSALAEERKAQRLAKKSSRAQDHNSTRSNKTASVADGTGPQGGGTGGGSKAQDHNSTRSNKTASVADGTGTQGGGTGGGSKAQDHNST